MGTNLEEKEYMIQLFFFISFIAFVVCWGDEGHRITALIANELTSNPKIPAILRKYLNGSTLWDVNQQYELGAIAWPDPYARTTAGRWSYDLHFAFTNKQPNFYFDRDCYHTCNYQLEQMGYCKKGQTLRRCCIVAGLEKYRQELYLRAVLGQTNTTAGEHNTQDFVTQMLMYLHFAGDIHQPLHVDALAELGGNMYHVIWNGSTLCGHKPYQKKCQLHHLWDKEMILKRMEDLYGQKTVHHLQNDPREADYAKHIYNRFKDTPWQIEDNESPANWASESSELSYMAYTTLENEEVSYNYYNLSINVIERQLFKAGTRIHHALETWFGDHPKPCYSSYPPYEKCAWQEPLCRPAHL